MLQNRKILKCQSRQREPAAARLLSMGHAAAFTHRIRSVYKAESPVWTPLTFTQSQTMFPILSAGFFSFVLRAQVSSVTLTESALSSPRVAAAPGAAAPSRSTRVRSFFQRPALHAALFASGMFRCTGTGVDRDRDREREREIQGLLSAAGNR